MSEACCEVPSANEDRSICPANGVAGRPVDWTTVAALTTGRVPPKQEFRLCRTAGCEVVYYGAAGSVLTVGDLSVRPGFKAGGDGLICYCFLLREDDIVRQVAETGKADVLQAIKDEVQAGNCACEVRNPSGGCCLGEVRQTIRALEKELGVRA